MLRLLRLLFLGHDHKWIILQRVDVVDEDDVDIGTRYYCQCEQCGSIKRFG